MTFHGGTTVGTVTPMFSIRKEDIFYVSIHWNVLDKFCELKKRKYLFGIHEHQEDEFTPFLQYALKILKIIKKWK